MDSIKHTLLIVGVSLALAACATVPPPEYTSDHPANPAAPEGPELQAPSALAAYRSFRIGGKPPDAGLHRDSGADKDPAAPDLQSPVKESGHEH